MAFIPAANNAATAAASSAPDSTSGFNWAQALTFEVNSNGSKHSFEKYQGAWKPCAWLSKAGRVMTDGKSGFLSMNLWNTDAFSVYGYQKHVTLNQEGENILLRGEGTFTKEFLASSGYGNITYEKVLLAQSQIFEIWSPLSKEGLNLPEATFSLSQEVFAKAKTRRFDCSFRIHCDFESRILVNPAKSWVSPEGEINVTSTWKFTNFQVEVGDSIPMGTPAPAGSLVEKVVSTTHTNNSSIKEEDILAKAYIVKFGSQLGSKLGNKAHKVHIEALNWGEEAREIALFRLAQLAAHPDCKLSLEKVQKMVLEVDPNLQLPELEVDPQTEEVKPQAPEPSDSDEEIWN